jgi:hypothetical protein
VTFDSVAAVQARIAQIQQLISGSASEVGGSRAPAPTSTQSPEFASLLADAMGTGTSTDPLSSALSAPSTDASGTATGATSMVSQLMKLSQLASNPTGTSAAAPSNPTTQLFVSNATAEKGRPYVAISLGDGEHTIEARGHAYGTNVFDNAGGRSSTSPA